MSVYPSGLELASSVAATVPEAPVLLTMLIATPRSSTSASERAMISVPPPAAEPTRMVIGRLGYPATPPSELPPAISTDIPRISELEPTIDKGLILTQNEIAFKKIKNTETGIDKKRRVLNLDSNGEIKLRFSYQEQESTEIKASGNHLKVEIDDSNPMNVYKDVVSVKNLDVIDSVYFEEIIMGKAIIRRSKETKEDGTVVDKGLDIFVV